MNVTLQTNTQDPKLEFVNLVKYKDDAGYCSNLVVVAYGFSAELLFNFETFPMNSFLQQLEVMDTALQGKAVLKSMYEDPFIMLEMRSLGHVEISGNLVCHGELTQRLQFEFFTDQTVIRPLINDLLAVKNGTVAV